MKLSKRNLTASGVLTALVLALIASIVSGREHPQPASAAPAAARPGAERAVPADSLANLDLEKLKRPAKQEAIPDLLGPRSAPQAAPVSAGADTGVPAAPVAPPLPFSYLGKLIDGGKTTVFVARGTEHFSVAPGVTIDKTYQVERITPTKVTFVFLPLGARQSLTVPALDQEPAAK